MMLNFKFFNGKILYQNETLTVSKTDSCILFYFITHWKARSRNVALIFDTCNRKFI